MKRPDKIIVLFTMCVSTVVAIAYSNLLSADSAKDEKTRINTEYAISEFSDDIDKYNELIENDKSYIINIESDLLQSGKVDEDNEESDKKDESTKVEQDKPSNNKPEDKPVEIDYNVMNNVSAYYNPENFKNTGIANVDSYLNVRKGPGTNTAVVGKMPPNSECTIISSDKGWAKIKSGDVSGYVKLEYIVTGKKAQEIIEKKGKLVIVVDCTSLRVRAKESTNSEILYKISKE